MARKQKFDWIEFHKQIHNGTGVDPQRARVIPSEKIVQYDLFVKGFDPNNEHVLSPFANEDDRYFATIGFTAALCVLCPALEIIVGDGKNEAFGLRKREVRATYVAKTSKEILDILDYLKELPADDQCIRESEANFYFD